MCMNQWSKGCDSLKKLSDLVEIIIKLTNDLAVPKKYLFKSLDPIHQWI